MKLDKFTVGKRYGKALFELAMEEKQLDEVYTALISLRSIFEQIPDLGNILTDTRLHGQQKRAIMTHLLSDNQEIVHDFLEIVYQYNRMDDLLLIIDEYERRYDDEKGIVEVKVTTAVPLSATQKDQLTTKTAENFGYQTAILIETVDPTIIGGVIVEANHRVIDGSIKSRLDALRQRLNG